MPPKTSIAGAGLRSNAKSRGSGGSPNPAVVAHGTLGTHGNRGQEVSCLTNPLGETLFEIKFRPFRVFRVFRGLQLPDSGLCHRSVSQLRRRPWRNNRSVRPIVAKRFGVWRLASAMEGFAAWLKAEASLHTPKLKADLVLLAAGLKAEASLHTPKRFAQIRPLISPIAVNGRDEQSLFSSPGLPTFGTKCCDEPLIQNPAVEARGTRGIRGKDEI